MRLPHHIPPSKLHAGPRVLAACQPSGFRLVRPNVAAQYMVEKRRRDLVLDNVSPGGAEEQGDSSVMDSAPLYTDSQAQEAYNGAAAGFPQDSTSRVQPPSPQGSPPRDASPSPGVQGSAADSSGYMSSDGWEGAPSTGSSPGSVDDGGWGEPGLANDWGDAFSQYTHPFSNQVNHAPDNHTSYNNSNGFSHQSAWQERSSSPGGSRASSQQPFPQGNYTDGSFQAGAPGAGPQAAGAGAGEDAWQFFAASGSRGGGESRDEADYSSSRFTGQGPRSTITPPSDVTILSRTEVEAVLPVSPTGRQADYFQPRSLSERAVQLMGSLGASLILSKSTVLAAPALLYPLWSPWIRAALKNVEVQGGPLKTVGLWRSEVLEVEVLQNNTYRPGGNPLSGRTPAAGAVVRLLMGDPWEGGARVQLEFPYQPKSELLRPGESVEALVLSKDNAFVAFKVIREVYAPGLGLWLAEYPFVDRTAFLDVSLQIERSRQSSPDAWAPPRPPPPPGATGPFIEVSVVSGPGGAPLYGIPVDPQQQQQGQEGQELGYGSPGYGYTAPQGTPGQYSDEGRWSNGAPGSWGQQWEQQQEWPSGSRATDRFGAGSPDFRAGLNGSDDSWTFGGASWSGDGDVAGGVPSMSQAPQASSSGDGSWDAPGSEHQHQQSGSRAGGDGGQADWDAGWAGGAGTAPGSVGGARQPQSTSW